MHLADTIVALATPPGRSGIGVVRLSGSRSTAISELLLALPPSHTWLPWKSVFAGLLDESGNVIDRVVATFYQAPRSYTSEDVVEISCHGSPVVLRHCLEAALLAGARMAEPGEFTLRAYIHGRIDLPQAEAVRDLIHATTLYQARVAAQQIDGGLSRRLSGGKNQLLELISLLEAGIDFAEDDISVAPSGELLDRLARIRTEFDRLARSFEWGKLVRSGFSLAIVGLPNVGKSSLFNRLLDQDRAIVTDIPGTTRDTISETASLEGIPVRFIDTAGIREGLDPVETLGIERSRQAMADADLILVVIDGSIAPPAQEFELIAAASSGVSLIVANKADLPPGRDPGREVISVSAQTGAGVGALRRRILESITPETQAAQEPSFITSIRHEQLLRESLEFLDRARTAVEESIPHEMVLIDLYGALQGIDAITGATTADDILNRIFSTFCIGK